ncbi:MAG TPA: ComEC/Rec2 family competence protein [Gemmatimonadaceae bacterium]
MPMIVWVLVAIAGGLFAGFTLPWQIGLGMCGVLAWLAASDFIPSATVLYFAAAFALSISGPKPLAGASVIVRPDSTQLGERMRLRAAHTIDLAFGSDAPTARALLVADQSEIPRDVKRAYTDAGIVHMLAISGLHVSIVAASLALMLNLFRVPARIASFATAGIIMGYVFMLGFPAPALRAAVMVCVATACHACQRHTSRWSILAVGGIVPLMKPETVLAVGYQLSMAGMAAVIAAGAISRRGRLARLRGWRGRVVQSLVVSGVATVVTAPLVACWFGRLSLIGPLTNLAADPVIAIVQPMLFLALVLSPWPAAAQFVASAAHPLLVAFEAIARFAASLPYAAVTVSISPIGVTLSIIAALAIIAACTSRFPGRAIAVAAAAVSLTIWTA